jgi:hypothetical protein
MKAFWLAILRRFGRRARLLKRLERCGYFDSQWYLRTYTDVAADPAGISVLIDKCGVNEYKYCLASYSCSC